MATVVITAVEDIVLKGYCMMICNRNLFYEKRMALVCVRVCKKRFFAFVFCFMCQLSLCRFVSSINRSNAMACTGMKMQKVSAVTLLPESISMAYESYSTGVPIEIVMSISIPRFMGLSSAVFGICTFWYCNGNPIITMDRSAVASAAFVYSISTVFSLRS